MHVLNWLKSLKMTFLQMLRNLTHWALGFFNFSNLVISLFHMRTEVPKLISNMLLIGVFLLSLRTPVRRQLDRHTGRDSTSFMTEDHLYRKHLKCNFFFFLILSFLGFTYFPLVFFFFSFLSLHISIRGSVIFTVLFGTCF